MVFHKKYIDLPEGKVHYITGGSGPPLVCLHPASGVRLRGSPPKRASAASRTSRLRSGVILCSIAELPAGFHQSAASFPKKAASSDDTLGAEIMLAMLFLMGAIVGLACQPGQAFLSDGHILTTAVLETQGRSGGADRE